MSAKETTVDGDANWFRTDRATISATGSASAVPKIASSTGRGGTPHSRRSSSGRGMGTTVHCDRPRCTTS